MKVIIEDQTEAKEEIKFPCLLERTDDIGRRTVILATEKEEVGTYKGLAPIHENKSWKTRITSGWLPDFKPCKSPVTLIND